MNQGEKVDFPEFPDKDQPDKGVWLECLSAAFEEIAQDEEVIVVAHSLACILWFHYAASQPECFVVPKMGHINVVAGFGPWPWILKVCMNQQITL